MKFLVTLLLFLTVSVGYFWFRGVDRLYWDDTPSVAAAYLIPPPPLSPLQILKSCFAQLQIDGYRPISCWIRDMGRRKTIADQTSSIRLFVWVNAISQGLMASLIFLTGAALGLSLPFAIISTLLFVASTPNLTGALVISAGIQSLIPIFVCGGILAYWAIREKSKKWPIPLLASILLLGPYVREFLGVLPVVLFFWECTNFQKSRVWLSILSAAFVHALYPTLLTKLVGFASLPLVRVDKIGNLGASLSGGNPGKKWRVFLDLFNIIPPSLLLVCLLFALFALRRNRYVISSPHIKFLMFFFAVSFLPFIKIFHEQVHLSYALLPLVILLGFCLRHLWHQTHRHLLKVALAVLFSVTFADQLINVYTVRKVTRDMYDKIDLIADWSKQNMAPTDHLISQAHHFACIYLRSGFYFQPSGGFAHPRNMFTTDALKARMAETGGGFYFLDILMTDSKGRVQKRIPFIDDVRIEKQNLGELTRLVSRFPFIDPLRNFMPLKTWYWHGSPDLEFDFYRGPALNGSWFTGEVSATYTLYRIVNVL